jgi:hypothetical protein
MFQKLKPLFLVYILLLSGPLFAQRFNGNSYYSGFGLGDMSSQGSVRNMGMGGTGVSHSHIDFINNLNPALLHADRYANQDSATFRWTLFDASMLLTARKSSTSTISQNNYSANFNYFTWSVPISKRWTTNVGLQPYTQVSYKTTYRNAVVGSPSSDVSQNINNGVGGLYQAYWANGIDLNRNFSAGLQLSYIFGNRTDQYSTQLIKSGAYANEVTVLDNKISQHAGGIKPGIVYRKSLLRTRERDSTIYINVGATYEFFLGGGGRQDITIQTKDTIGNVFSTKPISSSSMSGNFPSVFRAGLSLDKPRSWMLAADFTYTPWSNYKGYSMNNKPFNIASANSYSLALGSEFHVRQATGKDERKRKILRAGVAYTKTPYLLNNIQLNDFSASIGASLPFGKSKETLYRPLSKLNLALVVGQRGTTASSLVKELYFKLAFGITISEEWFHKSKID